MSADRMEAVCARLEAAVSRLEKCGGGGAAAAAEGPASASVEAYDEIINGPFAEFMSLSASIGGDVATQAAMVKCGFDACRAFLVTASQHKKPSQDTLKNLLKPISGAVQEVQSFREKNRPSKQFNHLSAVSEAIGAIGWVAVEPKPGPYCKECSDSGQFYSNRVLKEAKDKGEESHSKWARSFIAALKDLEAYIKKFHTTGVVWNAQGAPVPATAVSSSGPPPAKAAPASKPAGPALGGGAGGPPAGLFAALNKGGDVTTGLKKVSKDQMTHKNPDLRASSVVKASGASKSAAAAPKAAAVKKPPRFERKGNKWEVEWQDGNQEIMIDDTANKQIVYIYKCTNSVITVKGKVNNITLDSCKKCGVVFEDCIAGLDVINCQSVKAQVSGVTPIVNIDKTDGCQIFLSKDSTNADIITAKSSEINISVPKADGEYGEYALAEQFVNQWNGKGFTTRPAEIAA